MTSKRMPSTAQPEKEIPDTEQEEREIPEVVVEEKEPPMVGDPENTIIIGGKLIEIKPTKLKYHRNNTAVFYKMLELYPLPDIMAMGENMFGRGRDGDKALADWLVAVTDDPTLISKEVYDEMDTGTIEKLLAIFRRVNKIDEKEEKLKNVEAPGNRKA